MASEQAITGSMDRGLETSSSGGWRRARRAIAWGAACLTLALGVHLLGIADPSIREQAIALPALPPAVLEAAARSLPDERVTRATVIRSNRGDSYELTVSDSGGQRYATFSPSGQLREIEGELGPERLPEPVRRSLAASAQAHWTIRRIELLHSPNALHPELFELRVEGRAGMLDLVFTPDGRRLRARPVKA